MKIVFISTMAGAPWGGSEELWSQAALRLQSEGYAVGASVQFWKQPAPALAVLAEAAIAIHMRRPIYPTKWQRLWANLARQPVGDLTSQASCDWLAQQNPDLVCISNGGASGGLTYMQQCQEAGIPYVTISQCVFEGEWPTDDQVARLLPAFQSAKQCFFVSRRNQELFETQIGEALPNAHVIRNPFKVPYDANVPWVASSSPLKLACVGRLEPKAKGQDILLQVLAREKWRQRDLQLQFYGQGPCEANLRKLAARLRPGQVEFKGHVANLEEIWADNHALILPSRYEGLPLAVVEAMLCSRMVIVSDVAGNAEFVEHGKSGFIAPAPTADLVDVALEEAWQRRADWQAMGITARKQATQFVPRDPVGEFCQKLLMFAK